MGDSGALVLGYTIYLFIVTFCENNANNIGNDGAFFYSMKAAPVVAICVLAVPLIDTFRVMTTRIKHRKSPFMADKNHVHHLLLSVGLKHKEVTFILLAVNLFFIGLGLLLRNLKIEIALSIVIVCAVTLIITLWRIVDKYKKKRELNEK